MIVVVGLIIFFFIYLHVKFNNRPQGEHDGHRRNNEISNHHRQDHHAWPSTSSAPSTRSSTTHAPLTPVRKPAKPVSPPKPHPSQLREVSRHKHQSKEVDNFSTTAYDGRDTISRSSTTHALLTPIRKPVSPPKPHPSQLREVSRHKHHSKEVDNFSTMAYDGRYTFSRSSTTHGPSTSVRKPPKPVSRPKDHARQSSAVENFSTRAIDGRVRLRVQ
ncbi:hypothetical protein Q3G72_016850 [Acer saccharum]|nr:hypothetical protein Q3G72_016850 [Acer saccharum]